MSEAAGIGMLIVVVGIAICLHLRFISDVLGRIAKALEERK